MFIEWAEEILKDNNNDKTIAIDGKTICSTDISPKIDFKRLNTSSICHLI